MQSVEPTICQFALAYIVILFPTCKPNDVTSHAILIWFVIDRLNNADEWESQVLDFDHGILLAVRG
ncbi:MAG: hypothetical protein Q8P73_04740 [bacterium]|nr:hypothetical protein [bacterium]